MFETFKQLVFLSLEVQYKSVELGQQLLEGNLPHSLRPENVSIEGILEQVREHQYRTVDFFKGVNQYVLQRISQKLEDGIQHIDHAVDRIKKT